MSFAKGYFSKVVETIKALDYGEFDNGIALIESAIKNRKPVIVFGNGGSGSNASHFICDWNKGISFGQENKIRGICLNDNLPMLMAYANDVSYESVFVEPLKNYLEPGSLVIGLSGSGNSKNVLKAIEFANQNGATTLALTGFDGGALKKLARHSVWIRINDMQVTEDLHLSFGHMAMQKISGTGCQIKT
jgi:D-sedoheptulose 7-phosphate isomerase